MKSDIAYVQQRMYIFSKGSILFYSVTSNEYWLPILDISFVDTFNVAVLLV